MLRKKGREIQANSETLAFISSHNHNLALIHIRLILSCGVLDVYRSRLEAVQVREPAHTVFTYKVL
jgi:hypothetical protein